MFQIEFYSLECGIHIILSKASLFSASITSAGTLSDMLMKTELKTQRIGFPGVGIKEWRDMTKWEDRQPVVIQDAQRAISRVRTCA